MRNQMNTSEKYDRVQQAIGASIDTYDIQTDLRQLGYEIELNEVDFGNHFGKLILGGGENETGCIIVLRVSYVQLGFDRYWIDDESLEPAIREVVMETDAIDKGLDDQRELLIKQLVVALNSREHD